MYNGWKVNIHGWFPSIMMLTRILDMMLAMSPMTLVNVATFFFFFSLVLFSLKNSSLHSSFFLSTCYCFFWCSKVPLSHSFHFVFFVVCHVLWILHCTCHYHQYNVIALITFSYPQIQLHCIHRRWLFL